MQWCISFRPPAYFSVHQKFEYNVGTIDTKLKTWSLAQKKLGNSHAFLFFLLEYC